MTPTEIKALDLQVLKWLHTARSLIIQRMSENFQVETKASRSDLVTSVDREVEQLYVELIRQADPDTSIISEEGYGDHPQDLAGHVWFIDPIDGTMNFVKQQSEFASMLALYIDGEPILGWIMDVMADDIIHGGPEVGVAMNETRLPAVQNVGLADGIIYLSGARLLHNQFDFQAIARSALSYRVYGSAGISFIQVLLGRAVGYASRMKPWDFAAGVALGAGQGLTARLIDGSNINMLSSGTVLLATTQAFADIQLIRN